MTKSKIIQIESTRKIPYQDADKVFNKIYRNFDYKFLLESKDVSHVYGRLSLIGVDPILKVSGKNEQFKIVGLNNRGDKFLNHIKNSDLSFCSSVSESENSLSGTVKINFDQIEETQRSKQKNISQIIRSILANFYEEEKTMMGLYGAFSYDFVRLFEQIDSKLPENEVSDFTLFLYDTFILFDHLKEKAEIIVYRETENVGADSISNIITLLNSSDINPNYEIENAEFALDKDEYKKLVGTAKDLAKKGELFEVVFSNTLKAKFIGDPFALYEKYREVNPSPYLFYFDFKDEQLVGASPEMMIRVENRTANLRPISGTAKRGADPIEDHENMLELLSNKKERAELDMLIDLGRNDLSRVCKPGIKVSDYRFVEKYSRVMHTVAHLTGDLKDDCTALDALIASLNAGTLTGAPKVAAMNAIEQNEKERRGYYGGTIGYMTFSGEMDTGIIIRTAHIKNGDLSFQVGATLLYDSDPDLEYQETLNKAQAFLDTFANQIK